MAQDDYQSYLLADGDKLSVEAVLERFSNKVEIRGAVYRAGIYQLDDSVTGTVRQLISKAEGLRGDAFLNRALLRRQQEDLTHEMIPYVKNTTIQDLIVKAGGLPESASMVQIDVSRRIKDPGSILSSNVIGKSFTVELANGLLIGEDKGFELEPYDIVFVRDSG